MAAPPEHGAFAHSRDRAAAGASSSQQFANGRYEVKRFLGEGGKKLVYAAHDSLLDRDVAFALIRTEGLDAEGLVRIRREAQTMGRLGDHPHVVSVYDTGDEGGQPFLVSQLMGGGDVEGLIERTEGHRLAIPEAVRIATEICRALEHAESHGVVHRDLKPGNVWLTADGTAKLGDFGLAVLLDRTRLTQAGMMVGTVSYMPPEQAMGGEVGPRSDLYSLGAMLYEMVTGRPPFIGDESVAIITQHLNVPPVAPSWFVPELPAVLDALILRLLEKDPSRRPSSAAEVRRMLEGVALTPTPPPTLGEGPGVRAGPLYGRAFVGREAELDQAREAFDRACSGQGGIVMVAGEPGIGKTALCEQVATYAVMRGGRALVGSCYEEGSLSLPYLPFVEAIRSYVVVRDPEELRRELGSGAAEVARIISEIRDRLPVSPVPRPQAPAPTSDPEDERWRLLQSVAGFLRAASTAQPLLIVLEDLQWADRGTLDLLTHLARQLAGARLLILGTYRDHDVDRAHPLSSTLAELRRDAGFNRMLLHGLSQPEVHRMISAIAGQEVTRSFSEAVHQQTEGNPLFVQEVVRYLAEAGIVVREGGRWKAAGGATPEMNIPEGLREVIGKRLSRLSPECNRLLSIASVVGRDFSIQALQAVADVDENELADALQEAVRVGVLQEQSRVGGASYRFEHAFMRQTLYEEISLPRRLRLHQQVARVLEEQYEDRLEDHAAELAGHFAHSSDAKDLGRAVEYSEIAAQKAISLNAYGEAVRLLDQALELHAVLDADDRVGRCDLLLALGQALLPAGDPQRVFEEVAPQALTLAEALGNRGRAARAARMAVDALLRYAPVGTTEIGPSFREWALRADRYAEPGTRLRVYADDALAVARAGEEDWAAGWDLAARALATAREFRDQEVLFHAASTVMLPWWPTQRRGEMLSLADDLTGGSIEGVSARTLHMALRPAQMLFLEAGDRARAERVWDQLDHLAARSQDSNLFTWPLLEAGTRGILDGDFSAAVRAADRMEEMGRDLGIRAISHQAAEVLRLGAQIYLGEVPAQESRPFRRLLGSGLALRLARAGKLDDARVQLRAALDRLRPLDRDDAPPPALAQLLEATVLVGDRTTAEGLMRKLDGVAAIGSSVTLYNVARHRGGAATLLGERDTARTAYAEALDWATRVRHRPEVALTRFQLAELLLGDVGASALPEDELAPQRAEGQAHLDFAVEEFRAMKMQSWLAQALRHKGLLHA